MLHFFFEINRSKPFGGVSTKYVLGGGVLRHTPLGGHWSLVKIEASPWASK